MKMSLRQEIAIVLVIKTVAIFSIWWLFFSADEMPETPVKHVLAGHQGSSMPSYKELQ